MNRAARIVTCPGCRGRSLYGPDNPYRPFCSQRCKSHDFGAWASEGYRVETNPSPDSADGEVVGDDPLAPFSKTR